MSTDRVFSALSLSEVLEQLRVFRLSGLLTFRKAVAIHTDEARVLVELGQPLRIRWAGYEWEASESTLRQCDAWGQIHFVFLPREPQRQLPAPAQSSHRAPSRLLHLSAPPPLAHEYASYPLPDSVEESFEATAAVIIPSLTSKARGFPHMNVPRYDRTIFLLINGSRTIADLAHLTQRSLSAIYGSLSRLRDQQLIEVPW